MLTSNRASTVNNISHSRTATNIEVVNRFLNDLEKGLCELPPSNIPNCETRKKRTKYLGRIKNTSNTCPQRKKK